MAADIVRDDGTAERAMVDLTISQPAGLCQTAISRTAARASR